MIRPLTPAQETAEREAIRTALAAASGHVGRTAATLGISPDTLHRRITAHGLRAWLSETYPRGTRQPLAGQARRPAGSGRRARSSAG